MFIHKFSPFTCVDVILACQLVVERPWNHFVKNMHSVCLPLLRVVLLLVDSGMTV
jgi:hypothetical protein